MANTDMRRRLAMMLGDCPVTMKGVPPITTARRRLLSLKAFGGTEQNGTPTPDAPVDIVSNNGVLKFGVLSTNLLDLANCTDGYYYSPAGEYAATPNARLSNYIPVKAGIAYTVGLTGAEGQSNVRVNLFDTGKNWLSQTVFISNAGEKHTQSITPTQDGFLAFSANFQSTSRVDWTTAQVVQGSYTAETMPEYEPYREGVYADGTVETINAHGKNLFDRAATTVWLRLNDDGTTVPANIMFVSQFISVKPNTTYTLSYISGELNQYRRICGYNDETSESFTGLIKKMKRNNGGDVGEYITTSFTTDANTNYIIVSVFNTDTNIQLEQGDTATEYSPYYDGGTATAEMLLKVGDYADVQSILDGVVTRKVGIKVFDGTEDWLNISGYYNIAKTNLGTNSTVLPSATTDIICTHYETISGVLDRTSVNVGRSYVNFKDDNISTLAGWKQWLANQYAAGTPVIVVYPLATPATEQVAGQTLALTNRTNVIDITQASLDNLELEVKVK